MSDPGELDCVELVELVTEYLDGALPDAERVRFERHLVYCGGCARHLTQVRATLLVMSELPGGRLPDAMTAGVLAAFGHWKRESAADG